MSARVSVRLVDRQADREPGISDPLPEAAIAVKTATTPEDMERLAGEAERLRLANHPGIVAFVEHQVGQGRAELHTVYAGDSLANWSGTLAQVAGLAAAVATTLADLHDMGLVHGRIDPTHVLVGADGRPLLCGLSPPGPEAAPADDIAGVGRLVEDVMSRMSTRAPRCGAFGWLASLRGPLVEERALGQVVLHATDPHPARRPTARALARSLLAAVPGAELPPPGGPAGDVSSRQGARLPEAEASGAPGDLGRLFTRAFVDQTAAGAEDVFVDRPWIDPHYEPGQDSTDVAPVCRSPRSAGQSAAPRRVIAMVGVVGALGGAAWFLAPAVIGHGSPGHDAPPNAENIAVDANAAAAGGGADAVPHGCPPVGVDATTAESIDQIGDIDGDGCPEGISIADGVIEVAGEKWAIGEPGDDIVLGDWNCDGALTPAAYRRATGEVFVFAGWAERGHPLTAEAAGRVEGGVALEAVASPVGDRAGEHAATCHALAVHLPDGQRRVLEVAP
jgi:eukaryotic-like serine/threonine-protein kinase